MAGRTAGAVELLAGLADELSTSAPTAARRVEVELLTIADVDLSVRPLVADRLERAANEPDPQEPTLSPLMLAHRAVAALMSASPAPLAADLAGRALNSDVMLELGMGGSQFFFLALFVLTCADRYVEARALFDRALAEARARGSAFAFVLGSAQRAFLELRAGALGDAEADGRSAVEVARLNDWRPLDAMGTTMVVESLLGRGDVAGAQAELREVDPGLAPGHVQAAVLLLTRGRVKLASGQAREAVEDLLEGGRRFCSWGAVNPAPFSWRSDAALGLVAMGERERALGLVYEEVDLARRWGTPRPLGVALRAAGLVEGGKRGIEQLREAVSLLEPSYARHELARTLVDLGSALRRANRRSDAREALRRGMDVALECGATSLARRGAAELRASGARPRQPLRTGLEALTPSERRVAQMAADDMSNAEIAQALFVTVKTVEMHLSGAYRKLGIGSRSELPAALFPAGTRGPRPLRGGRFSRPAEASPDLPSKASPRPGSPWRASR
jgi:DNA-binding CsgD family transcriptional regulator